MINIKGKCLCEQLAFEIYSENGDIYQCHCSKCRKTTGSSANANLMIKKENFSWLLPAKTLKLYNTPSGWISAFCSECGSKAPIEDKRRGLYYVPAGVIDDVNGLTVTRHIHVASKASWDIIGGEACLNDDGL